MTSLNLEPKCNRVESLEFIKEPALKFGFDQTALHPKDGLKLFGPIQEAGRPAEIRVGVVGHGAGLERYARWASNIQTYIPAARPDVAHQSPYPGFEAVFGCRWPKDPICRLELDAKLVSESIRIGDRHEAIYRTVGLYEKRIRDYIREQDVHVDLWFVIIPEEVYRLGRPESRTSTTERIQGNSSLTLKKATQLQRAPSLFPAWNEEVEIYKYERHFHNQLKARLLRDKAVIQVVRETTLAPEDFLENGMSKRQVQDPATVAWNLTTTSYFKSSGRPWKLAHVRPGVCYVGIVFKKDMTSLESNNACCGAQMFLDSGDGLVFKGAVGPWRSEVTKEYHLSAEKASELIALVIDSYTASHGHPPKELFIHGRTRFNANEWSGYCSAAPPETSLFGVRIRSDSNLKLFTPGSLPVIRGTAFLQSRRKGYLWSRGYIPRLQTYPGWEVPNPLSIEVSQGDADLRTVIEDVMGLTKINFNACIYGDGFPVTLRFADQVGEILTAAPLDENLPPLPFKHYI